MAPRVDLPRTLPVGRAASTTAPYQPRTVERKHALASRYEPCLKLKRTRRSLVASRRNVSRTTCIDSGSVGEIANVAQGFSIADTTASLWATYLEGLSTTPIRVKCATAIVMYSGADWVTQALLEKKPLDQVNPKRIFNMATFGLFDGFLGHNWFMVLDRAADAVFGVDAAVGVPLVAFKVAADQLVYAPFWYTVYFTTLGVLEATPADAILSRLRNDTPKMVVNNWIVWIPATSISFAFIPRDLRVLWYLTVMFLYVVFMSFVSNEQADGEAAPALTSTSEFDAQYELRTRKVVVRTITPVIGRVPVTPADSAPAPPAHALEEVDAVTRVSVECTDREGLMLDLFRAFAAEGLDILRISGKATGGTARNTFEVVTDNGDPITCRDTVSMLERSIQSVAETREPVAAGTATLAPESLPEPPIPDSFPGPSHPEQGPGPRERPQGTRHTVHFTPSTAGKAPRDSWRARVEGLERSLQLHLAPRAKEQEKEEGLEEGAAAGAPSEAPAGASASRRTQAQQISMQDLRAMLERRAFEAGALEGAGPVDLALFDHDIDDIEPSISFHVSKSRYEAGAEPGGGAVVEVEPSSVYPHLLVVRVETEDRPGVLSVVAEVLHSRGFACLTVHVEVQRQGYSSIYTVRAPSVGQEDLLKHQTDLQAALERVLEEGREDMGCVPL